jgi:mannose-1-phosphate guanylyltransferase
VPKPVVPVVDRPFLRHQIDLLARIGVREIMFSVAYQPERIEAVFGDGSAVGCRIHYVVEETALGTGGAVKNAESHLDDTTIVFNGDVLTDVDLPAVVQSHRESRARATLVLTPVPNPAAYGLVETDDDGRVTSFVEKPTDPSQIRTDTINAGIYVLDTATLGLMPSGEPVSIERMFFPALLGRGDLVRAWVHRGYWIDIGTPEKYLQVHRDILRGRFPVALDGDPHSGGWVHPRAHVDPGAELEGPFYIGPGCHVAAGAHVGPDAVLCRDVRVAAGVWVRDSVLWAGCHLGEFSDVDGSLLGANVRVGRHARLAPGAFLGEASVVSDHSRTH